MSRFNRNFELKVVTDRGTIIIGPPLRVVFDAQKSDSGGLNKATIKIFNLTESNRLAMTKDAEQVKDIPVTLRVGYEKGMETVFKGRVHIGRNYRDSADMATELYCLDGLTQIKNGFVSSATSGDPVDTILSFLPGIRRGKITARQDTIRPQVLIGDAMTLLNDQIGIGQTWYIDNEALYLLDGDQVVSSFVPEVSAATGLVSTPEREQSLITFDTLMNPALKIRGLCNVQSKYAPHLNGVYQIQTISYTGDNYGGTWNQQCTALLIPSYRVA